MNRYIWLMFFYSFFHLWLNILAEALRFGDRMFYREWWNAVTIEVSVYVFLYYSCVAAAAAAAAAAAVLLCVVVCC